MGLLKGFVMSLGMFSIIPVPKNNWNDKYIPWVIPSLPLVGILIGLIWYALAFGLKQFSVPPLLHGATALFIPFILSGFIHADGYMDTADAVYSRRDLAEKKRILKDPNVGAFAVIAIVGIILFQFCAVQTILNAEKALLIFAFIPAISRCVAGIAMLNLKPVFETGYNASLKDNTKRRHSIFICLLAAIILLTAWFTLGLTALALLIGALFGILATIYLYRQFQGLSGDLCGCIITISEFAALLCIALI